MGQYSKTETDGRLLIVTINRPEVYNALHPMANQELSDVFDEFAANPELWVAIITGAGDKAFCAGNDLKYHAELQGQDWRATAISAQGLRRTHQPPRPRQAGDRRRQRRRHGRRLRDRARRDIIIASDQARFALPEPRVGLAAGAGGMQRLSRQIPLKRAMGMMLTGRHVSAREGYELGFVTAVVPHAQADGRGAPLGQPDPRVLAHEHPRHQAGRHALARRSRERDRHAQYELPEPSSR